MTEQQILDEYEIALAALFALALARDMSQADFVMQLDMLVSKTMVSLFLAAGAHPDDLGNAALANEIAINRKSAVNVANDIYAGRYDERETPPQTALEGETKLSNRLLIWVRKAAVAAALGALFKPVIDKTIRTVWKVGATDHCQTCINLNGVVLTLEEWRVLSGRGIYPQSPTLACHGFNCKCSNGTLTTAPSIGLENVTISL